MKYLLLLLLVAVLWWFLRRSSHSVPERADVRPRVVEDIRRCDHCGVHFPVSDGEEVAGHYYCCSEHRRAAGQ